MNYNSTAARHAALKAAVKAIQEQKEENERIAREITSTKYREQYGLLYDLISEGEIEGLVGKENPNSGGLHNVYFNGAPVYSLNPTEDRIIYDDCLVELKTGTVDQGLPIITENSGIPSASYITEVNSELIWTENLIDNPQDRNPPPYQAGPPTIVTAGTTL